MDKLTSFEVLLMDWIDRLIDFLTAQQALEIYCILKRSDEFMILIFKSVIAHMLLKLFSETFHHWMLCCSAIGPLIKIKFW